MVCSRAGCTSAILAVRLRKAANTSAFQRMMCLQCTRSAGSYHLAPAALKVPQCQRRHRCGPVLHLVSANYTVRHRLTSIFPAAPVRAAWLWLARLWLAIQTKHPEHRPLPIKTGHPLNQPNSSSGIPLCTTSQTPPSHPSQGWLAQAVGLRRGVRYESSNCLSLPASA